MAEAGRLATWEENECAACSNGTFLAVFKIKSKAGGGTTTEPAGYQCAQCGHKADALEMQKAAYLKFKRQEMAALEAEMAGLSAPAAPPATPSRPGSLRS